MFDVFISYRRSGGSEMARLLYLKIKEAGYSPFLDVEGLKSGRFSAALKNAIENCTHFVLILSENSLDRCESQDDWIRKEFCRASELNKNIIPFQMMNFKWPEKMPEGMETLSKYNAVAENHNYFEASIDKLIDMLGGRKIHPDQEQRISNCYFSIEDKKELERMEIQRNVLASFDTPIYEETVKKYSSAVVLDVGTNTGDHIMSRLGSSPNVSKIIGIEINSDTVAKANEKYSGNGLCFFYECDVEGEDFSSKLNSILDEHSISGFDIINLNLVLLHLKNPFILLKKLRRFLNPGGQIIVIDIDDGMNIANPDNEKLFAQAFDICKRDPRAGVRSTGRNIHTWLTHSGYNDICLKRCGLSTEDMNYDQKEAMFDIYFSYLPDDYRIMLETQYDPEYEQSLQWLNANYNKLEEMFMDNSFWFHLGIMCFTATKH